MGDKEAIQGLVKRIKEAIPRGSSHEEEAPPELVEEIGAAFEREIEIQRIGASAVAEVEEEERRQRQ